MQHNRISKIHDDLRGARLTRRGAIAQFEDATKGGHKEYPRMPRIALPESILDSSLAATFEKRRSAHRGTGGILTIDGASALLTGLRIGADGLRPYPSGGARYPVETYLVGAVGEYTADVFHYQPTNHMLEHLWPAPEWFFGMSDLFPSGSPASQASAVLIFTGVWERSAVKYGDFAYVLSLLEAGHMAQNVLLSAASVNIGARPMEAFLDEITHDLLDIDGESEQALYTLALYPPSAT